MNYPSMKGGRTAPRNFTLAAKFYALPAPFNEGGADCPPKPCTLIALCSPVSPFNEGGADCPPKLADDRRRGRLDRHLQ